MVLLPIACTFVAVARERDAFEIVHEKAFYLILALMGNIHYFISLFNSSRMAQKPPYWRCNDILTAYSWVYLHKQETDSEADCSWCCIHYQLPPTTQKCIWSKYYYPTAVHMMIGICWITIFKICMGRYTNHDISIPVVQLNHWSSVRIHVLSEKCLVKGLDMINLSLHLPIRLPSCK